ncbi:MAG: hypothetical protein FJZ00_09025, partial [Candidatus Sericytochromatia bacterium]|nr:hypothetical protein [Candidatus Tanganyikabacteria bacterium]
MRKRTEDYQQWVEAFARNHRIPIEWADDKALKAKGFKREDYVRPYGLAMERRKRFGPYFILKSLEQGPKFGVRLPKYPTDDPHYRLVSRQRGRYTHYYFYIRDDVLGPLVLCVGSFLPFQTTYYLNGHHYIARELQRHGVRFRRDDNAFLGTADLPALQAAADRLSPEIIRKRLDYWTLVLGPKFSKQDRAAVHLRREYSLNQVEYCRNFIFRRHFPIHQIFERSCELGVFRLTADIVTQIFGVRKHKRLRGKLHTMLEKLDHGHHVWRVYCKSLVARMYEKFGTFLRVEVCVNRLKDLGLNKGLDQLPALRAKLVPLTDRLAAVEADLLNVHVDAAVFQRLARPTVAGRTKIPGIKIHDTRMLRLMEVLLHGGPQLAGWRASQIHAALQQAFGLTLETYSVTQLRYDLRKLKAHGLLARDGRSYRYRLTDSGLTVAAMFVLFHKHVCGPLANTLFHHRPSTTATP